MKIPSKTEIEMIKKMYPVGCRIMLDHMDDPYSPTPPGTVGTVEHIDSIGQIHWSGSGLALIYGVDKFHKI